ncbi:helix-turn-helix domain-containing protein [Streptomyces sp. SYSU K21746]
MSLQMFGALVKCRREGKGWTQLRLAKSVGYSESWVRKLESGGHKPKPDQVDVLERVLEAEGSLEVLAKFLVRDGFPEWFAEYANLEAEAIVLQSYDTHVLKGLLQTEAYARAVISSRSPVLSDEEIERRVQARLSRHGVFTRHPLPTLSFVIEAWILGRPLGGRAVLKEQLGHLLELGRLPNVSIQIMPIDCQAHAGVDGPMTLLETPDHRVAGYVEGQGKGRLITDLDEVSAMVQRYGTIRTQALNTGESARYIRELEQAL